MMGLEGSLGWLCRGKDGLYEYYDGFGLGIMGTSTMLLV